MSESESPQHAAVPSPLRRAGTDEYTPSAPNEHEQRLVSRALEAGRGHARRLNRPLADYWSSRLGTATSLLAINEEYGEIFYEIPSDAGSDSAAAEDGLDGEEVVIDVHTHFMGPRPELQISKDLLMSAFRESGPRWWRGLDGMSFYSFAEYVRCIFLESETAVAVLTTPPPDHRGVPFLTNEDMGATRELFDRVVGSGRLLCHATIHPTDPGSLDTMDAIYETIKPVAWKVYTLGRLNVGDGTLTREPGTSWMLDDEEFGLPFLERSRQMGVRNICSHKGLSRMVDNGSPRDIGPCARLFPDLKFGVYHSGYEGYVVEDGYSEETRDDGVNRLVTTVLEEGIGPNTNVFADLGTTWYQLIKKPREAAHVLGKLLVHIGEDNVLWGTDGIWYGPPQPVIDAFRCFQIPDELCERYGYPKLTPSIRAKVLGLNAARFYDIDIETARDVAGRDDLGWAGQLLDEYERAFQGN